MTAGNVLVTCGGKWVGMVVHLRQAMARVPALAGGRLIVADMAPVTPAGCFADQAVVVPPVHDASYVDRLLAVCAELEVKVVVPIIDIDLQRLAPELGRFEMAGTTVVCPPADLVELCLDKAAFQTFAEGLGVAMPERVATAAIERATYPLFYKPRQGFGSQGAGLARTPAQAADALTTNPDLLFQRWIDADELSVDAFVSRQGGCPVRVQRLRSKVVGGEAWQSRTVHRKDVAEVAAATLHGLAARGFRGPINLQLFLTPEPLLLEVNPRLGSASVFSNFACGGRLFAAVLAEACGGACDGDPDDYRLDLMLYRFLGDLYHDASGPLAVIPSGR